MEKTIHVLVRYMKMNGIRGFQMMIFIAVTERCEKMDDYIKREDAIKPLEGWNISGEMILATVPTADVRENVRGEWIEPQKEGCTVWDKRAYAQCSICGYKQYFGREKNFRPNCGADMRPKDA